MGECPRFAILGPLRAWRGGKEIDLGSPQQRAVLAVLLMRHGRQVSISELVDALWDDEPPRAAVGTVRTYISRLRRALGPDLVRTAGEGYVLRIDEDDLDVARFRRMRAQATALAQDGNLRAGHAMYERALGLWTGVPLAGVPGHYAESTRIRLAECRASTVEDKVELDLRLGRHAEAIAMLVPTIDEHPLRERLRELWMRALYRSGRQADALAVYEQTRRMLADELGIDPGAALKSLHQQILSADPVLDLDAAGREDQERPAAERPLASTPRAPAQLPADLSDFTGHAATARTAIARLSSRGTRGNGVPVVAISGLGGAGKSSLAVHVAHAVADEFPDGQLYADLEGSGACPADPHTVLAGFLRALDGPECALPDGLEERAATFRTALSDRRVLVVLDDAVDVEQVRWLLPGAPGSAVIVTSRRRLVGLPGAVWTDLTVLEPSEALDLLARIVGAERVAREPDAARDLVALCGCLPLAVRIAGSRLAARPGWRLRAAVDRLRDETHRLDELRSGELSVERALGQGFGQLDEAQTAALRLAARLDGSAGPAGAGDAAGAAGTEVTTSGLARLAGTPESELEQTLESLVDLHLLVAIEPGRYRLPDLVRLYARRV